MSLLRRLGRNLLRSGGGSDRPLIVPKSLTNLVQNGDFSNGTTGFVGTSASITAANNVLSATGNGAQSYFTAHAMITGVQGNKYYIKAKARVTSSVASNLILYSASASWLLCKAISSPAINVWHELSGVVAATNTNVNPLLYSTYADAATASGKVMEVQYVLALDLTALFGAGKEPSAWQVDMWLKDYDPTKKWFDGTKTLSLNYSPKRLTNLVANGDFSLGTQGWVAANFEPISVDGNVLSAIGTGNTAYNSVYNGTGTASVVGRKVYVTSFIRVRDAVCTQLVLYVRGATSGIGVAAVLATPIQDSWNKLSAVYTVAAGFAGNYVVRPQADYASAAIAKDKYIDIKNVLLLDLTAIFGAGNEPTAAQMDAILARVSGNSWFDGDTCIPISWTYAFNGQSSVSLVNLVTNGDFSNGTTGWTPIGATVSAADKVMSIVGNGTTTLARATQSLGIPYAAGQKIYLRVLLKVTNSVCVSAGMALYGSTTQGTIVGVSQSTPNANEIYPLSIVATVPADGAGNLNVRISNSYADNATQLDKVLEAQFACAINLTTVFGAGKEPSKEEMDLLMAAVDPVNKWFSGTRVLEGNLNPLAGSALSAITRRESRLSTGGGGIAARDNIVTDGLVLWLDGRDFTNQPNDTVWMDRSPYGNHAVASGLAYTMLSGSDRQGGVKFDGVDDFFETAAIMQPEAATLELAMIYGGNDGPFHGLISWSKKTLPHEGFWVGMSGADKIRVYSGAYTTYFDSLEQLVAGNTYHVLITFDRTNSRIFIMGQQQAIRAQESFTKNAETIRIGKSITSSEMSTSTIKSIRVYNRALSDAEIAQNYRASLA